MKDLGIKVFLDSANADEMFEATEVDGFTTNPTLMRQAGVANYEAWAKDILAAISRRPVSFEVLADDFDEMERQARKIASWGENVYVKIPVTNTKGEVSYDLIHRLSCDGIRVNVTAVMTSRQVMNSGVALKNGAASILSIFAGRIADTGWNPNVSIIGAIPSLALADSTELLWASARQVYDVMAAHDAGCQIITLPGNLLAKLNLFGKNLTDFSLETVRQFYNDAKAAGYTL